MKFLFLLSILFLIACNDSSDSLTAAPDSVEREDTTIVKAPEVDSTADMLRSSTVNNEAWEKKKKAGISWLGIGTEPFWSIERKKDSIIFHMSDWEKPVVLKANRTINSKDSVVYSGRDHTEYLETRIVPGECSDGMSDRKYDYAVTVIHNGHTYKGCAVIF
jgi:uncharacterized membrane protein